MSLPRLRLALPIAFACAVLFGATAFAQSVDDSSAAQVVPDAVAAAPVVPTVNANTASIDELTQAFQAAGIPAAARWAREVDEYRPYPTDDPSLAKLRGELAKYNPGQDVVDQIVATLTL